MEDRDIWNGVPPVGSRPIRNKWTHLMILLSVILVEWLLWATYRYLSLPIIESAFSRIGFIFHIFAAPIIGLGPILIYWKFIAKEKGLPWKFTKKNLFTSVTIGAIAAAVLMILYQGANWLILVVSGQVVPSTTGMISLWKTSVANGDLVWFLLMTFTFFFIVGPVEELQYRSFLQDQVGRSFKPSTGMMIASAMFALSHLPIYFLVYGLSPIQVLFTLCWTFTMGSVLGIFYFQSRNIWGPIIMHGFWDWVLSVWILNFQLKDSFFELGHIQEILWLSALIPVAIITGYLLNIAYSTLWKKDRPDRSFGWGPIRPLSDISDRIGDHLSDTRLIGLFRSMDSSKLKFRTRVTRTTFSVVIVVMLTLLLSGPGAIIPDGSLIIVNEDPYGIDDNRIIFSFTESIYVAEGDEQNLNIPMNDTWLISSIKISVFWMDEDPTGFRYSNQPDSFFATFDVTGSDIMEEGPTDSGSILFVWVSDPMNMTNVDASVHIRCVEAGDQTPIVDPVGIRRRADNGNEITLIAQIEYYETLIK